MPRTSSATAAATPTVQVVETTATTGDGVVDGLLRLRRAAVENKRRYRTLGDDRAIHAANVVLKGLDDHLRGLGYAVFI